MKLILIEILSPEAICSIKNFKIKSIIEGEATMKGVSISVHDKVLLN